MKLARVHVLGVPVDVVDSHSALAKVRAMLSGNKNSLIFAVNPEKVMAAQQNQPLLSALMNASLLIPDGIGVVIAARLLEDVHMARVPGADFMPEICDLAAREGFSVFLYGGRPGIAAKAAEVLRERYPGLLVAGTQHGYVQKHEMETLIDTINASGADVLFVALGSPTQELWLDHYRDRLTTRVSQGVGGTFDAICGHIKRAPKALRTFHLEWFYRLVTEPRRAKRQSALPRFVSRVLRQALARNLSR